MSHLGVGLIGTGYMGKCHALAWRNVEAVFGDVPPIRLVHLADVTQEQAEHYAKDFGFAKSSGNWRDVIADPEVQVISVTTPNQFHPEMAIAALDAGKHLWCEKPMAPTLAEAEAMTAAAQSGQVTVVGYGYIQSPPIRHIQKLLKEGAIGKVTFLRIEVEEDFMADPTTPFFWKHESKSGYGALYDFAVHPLSLVHVLFGKVARVVCNMSKPYAERRTEQGDQRAVETYDVARGLFELERGIAGVLTANRSAWGRKGRIALQIFGSEGSILFDQERFNELQLYLASDRPTEQGFRTILMGPQHEPYDRFIPAPGHGLGFNDIKVIECHELVRRIGGEPAHVIDFNKGLAIERTVHALARSHGTRSWVDVH